MYSNALNSSDVSWYRDTFGMMHRYSCTLYCPISSAMGTHKNNSLNQMLDLYTLIKHRIKKSVLYNCTCVP